MAISHKGMRKIVVEDKLYYYKVKGFYDSFHDGGVNVVIESPDGKVHTHKVWRDTRWMAFTPKDVKALILGEVP